MAWVAHRVMTGRLPFDVRRIGNWKSFCRKCSCHHPLDTEVAGLMKGCICNPTGRRGECGRYVPTDNLEFLEYLVVLQEEESCK